MTLLEIVDDSNDWNFLMLSIWTDIKAGLKFLNTQFYVVHHRRRINVDFLAFKMQGKHYK